MPLDFLRRRRGKDAPGGPAGAAGPPAKVAARGSHETSSVGASQTSSDGAIDGAIESTPASEGLAFEALTEEWRLVGRVQLEGRLSDVLNRREAIPISDVSWAPIDGSEPLLPASGLKSVDPYDLILVFAGMGSLPPLSEEERAAHRIHKVAYDVTLQLPPFQVLGTVLLFPGTQPERLLDRATDMFVPVVDAVVRLGDVNVGSGEVDVILVNRFYLKGVNQVDMRTGAHPRLSRIEASAGPGSDATPTDTGSTDAEPAKAGLANSRQV